MPDLGSEVSMELYEMFLNKCTSSGTADSNAHRVEWFNFFVVFKTYGFLACTVTLLGWGFFTRQLQMLLFVFGISPANGPQSVVSI